MILTVGAGLALIGFALYRIGRLLSSKVGEQSRGGAIIRDEGNMANGHCHSDSMANGKHKRNGSLRNEKKMN